MSSVAVILAAGRSTRMKSRRPKVLHEVCGRSMLRYVLDACFEAGCGRVIVVVGHGKDEVIAQFAGDARIDWVEQTEQLGTGHAVRVCESLLAKQSATHPDGDVFILAGDGPLVRADNLRALRQAHKQDHAAASLATAVVDEPAGYGRIVRTTAGDFLEIVEQLDASPAQRDIREINVSLYCAKADELLFALARLKNDNKKGEYYLTDVFGILRNAGKKVTAVQAVAADDVLSVNSRDQLADVDAILQDRIQQAHRTNGVGINSAANVYIEAGATIGPDTIIHPFSFVGRDASIGAECVIGPFALVPRDAVVPEGTTIAGNVRAE
ncbi:NTP transferase domain-containing protein [Humisphaera borealis]|uniref:NTP transferase domain-containing protein n=1 Tax=Humisphaera borealis TaxID=2807512 RepID=A0A7M2WR10_9BACT|nr:NTP transferase domain-containing protein [Humisphaera borealis]QOV87863.1 NTP transferase domain-containing protein [Humisphaera borealis]